MKRKEQPRELSGKEEGFLMLLKDLMHHLDIETVVVAYNFTGSERTSVQMVTKAESVSRDYKAMADIMQNIPHILEALDRGDIDALKFGVVNINEDSQN